VGSGNVGQDSILMTTEIDFKVTNYSSREDLRRIVVSQLLQEKAGLGSGDKTSRYRYNVETLTDGRRIYLTRPAYLKKGFDFRISVEGMQFLTRGDWPKHDDIFSDLRAKRRSNPAMAKRLHDAIQRVYGCEDPDDILDEYKDLSFGVGYSVEMILKVIKWFFIEQDIRDWNYSGRAMFMGGVKDILL
jgi:hypothetical protein